MKLKVKVRNFKSSDTERLLEFRKETGRISFPGEKMDKANTRKNILMHAEKHPGTIKVAESQGVPVGYVMFRPRKSSFGSYGHVDIIFVEKAYRHHGVGALLLKEAEGWLRRKGINRINAAITLTNNPSLDFFSKEGYLPRRTVVEKRL